MRREMQYLFSAALLLLGAQNHVGCSSFNRDWNALAGADQAEKLTAASGIEGRWAGVWLSDANGHTGNLRCIIARHDDGGLLARYRATYGWFFTFEYDMPMQVQPDGDTLHFSAQADLGWLAGGMFDYQGVVIGDALHATYTSKGDHGTFDMTRVGAYEPAKAVPDLDDASDVYSGW